MQSLHRKNIRLRRCPSRNAIAKREKEVFAVLASNKTVEKLEDKSDMITKPKYTR